MSSLLIVEPPLQVLPTLARRIGLVEAIVLQQVHYLALRAKADGWVQKSTDEWCDVFCFVSKRTLVRALTHLRSQDLLLSEVVPVSKGRISRYKVNHDALEELAKLSRGHATLARPVTPDWRDGSRQIGVTPLIKGTAETTKEEHSPNGECSVSDASHPRRIRPNPTDPGDVERVFSTWVMATGRTERTMLTAKRRRVVERALKSHGADDCLDAVQGWQHSPHHCGENEHGTVFNDIELLLRDAAHIEKFRDLQRQRGVSNGNVAACPGPDPPADLAALWAPIATELERLVPETVHAIWLKPLHPHGEHDGALVLGADPAIAAWVGERFMEVLVEAAGRQVIVVKCGALAA